jgi:hypothetical protein
MTCDENNKRRVEAKVQALLEAEDDTPLEKVRIRDMQKLIKSLKLITPVDCWYSKRMPLTPSKKAICKFDTFI